MRSISMISSPGLGTTIGVLIEVKKCAPLSDTGIEGATFEVSCIVTTPAVLAIFGCEPLVSMYSKISFLVTRPP